MIAVLDWLRRPDPAHENTLRRALHAEGARIERTAAPGQSGATAQAERLEGTTAMTTIVTRHARDLHAGDIVTHDPDHDRDVRWRVQAPPKLTAFGIAWFDYTDLADGSRGTAWFDALARLPVEPAAWLERAR